MSEKKVSNARLINVEFNEIASFSIRNSNINIVLRIKFDIFFLLKTINYVIISIFSKNALVF